MDAPINPAPPSTVPPTPNPIQMAQTPKSSSGALKFFIILLVLVLFGGTAFASYKYFFSAKYSPESAVKNMLPELFKVKSLSYVINGESTFENEWSEGGTIKVNLNGSSDWHDSKNVLSKNNLSLDYADKDGAFSVGGTVEILSIAKVLYLKLTKIPDFGFLDLSLIKDQWIKIEPSDAETVGVSTKEELEAVKETAERVLTIISETPIFILKDKLGQEEIDGVKTYHLKLNIDKTELKSLVRKINDLLPPEERSSTENLAEADKTIDKTEFEDFDVWLGVDDALLYRYVSKVSKQEIFGVEMSSDTEWRLSNYNQPLKIDAPQDAKSFDEVIAAFEAQMAIENQNNPIEYALSDLQYGAEWYYADNDTYKGFCADPEAKTSQKEIVDTNPKANYICKDNLSNGQSYAIQATFLPRGSSTPETWCIDGTGFFDPGKIGTIGCVE